MIVVVLCYYTISLVSLIATDAGSLGKIEPVSCCMCQCISLGGILTTDIFSTPLHVVRRFSVPSNTQKIAKERFVVVSCNICWGEQHVESWTILRYGKVSKCDIKNKMAANSMRCCAPQILQETTICCSFWCQEYFGAILTRLCMLVKCDC